MISVPHRNNSDFQLRYFMAGSCHTPDGLWALMYGQKIDAEHKIRAAEGQALIRQANIMEAEETIADENAKPSAKMKARAKIIEVGAAGDTPALNLEAAKNELATINAIMAEVEPFRKYRHLPLLEANEMAQRDEWRGELMTRAEDYLVTSGTIPQDQFNAMRRHPDFVTHIAPRIQETTKAMRQAGGELFKLLRPQSLQIEGPSDGG